MRAFSFRLAEVKRLLLLAVCACGDNQTVPDGPVGDGASLLQFTPCRTPPLECATLVVPADWSQPSGDTIALPVVRGKARDSAHRLGVLTFNFGGPGGGTLEQLAMAYPNQPIASFTQLADRFDFVLMDWRGVGTTSPALQCLTPALAARLDADHFGPVSDA